MIKDAKEFYKKRKLKTLICKEKYSKIILINFFTRILRKKKFNVTPNKTSIAKTACNPGLISDKNVTNKLLTKMIPHAKVILIR